MCINQLSTILFNGQEGLVNKLYHIINSRGGEEKQQWTKLSKRIFALRKGNNCENHEITSQILGQLLSVIGSPIYTCGWARSGFPQGSHLSTYTQTGLPASDGGPQK